MGQVGAAVVIGVTTAYSCTQTYKSDLESQGCNTPGWMDGWVL